MTEKQAIVFLDIDGPMIPVRAYFLPGQTSIASLFDPCATSMLLRLVEQAEAQIVLSSSWASSGKEKCVDLLEKNGIDPTLLHKDWATPRRMSSYRIHEIKWWLEAHPETTHWVAIDDEALDVSWIPNSVLCDAYEGFSWRNYLECCVYLDTFDAKDNMKRQSTPDLITYFKRREIWRTKRMYEEGSYLARDAAEMVFPLTPRNED